MKIFEDIEDDDFDYEDAPKSKYPFLTSLQKKYSDKQIRKQDRVASREKNQRDFEKRVDRDDYYSNNPKAVHKSEIRYKPFKTPLIRFGKFGKSSKAFVGHEFDGTEEDSHNFNKEVYRNSESGVSCYEAILQDGHYHLIEPHHAHATWNSSADPFIVAAGKYRELLAYLDHGTPMDIFAIRGHLRAYGKNDAYIDYGSDGEPLLDTRKPYDCVMVKPETVFIGRVNYVEWMLRRFGGIDKIRYKSIDFD